MAETTRKRLGELTQGVFAVLIDRTEPLAASQVLKLTAERVPPTSFEHEMLPKYPKIRRFDNTIRFATVTTVKAGWLVKAKGEWSLTDEGRIAYDKFTEPEEFRREAERLYRAWKQGQPQPDPAEPAEEQVPEDETAATFEDAEEAAWREIRDHLAQMPPYDFQNLVAALLKAMGYHVLWVAPPGPDRGVDIIAHNDPLGTSSPRIKVQVKRQIEKVGGDGIRSFIGTLGNHDVGIYVSAGGFTPEAEREARSQEQRRVTLLDLNRLVELWIEHSPKLDDADRQRLPLKPIHFLTPRE